ncbi:MAG: two-component system sensor histidine kinase NtrB [Thermodesulfobacteriota bacterium]
MENNNIKIPKYYEGKLLNQEKSYFLKKSLLSYIKKLKSINEFLIPSILYISAWENDKNEIWYEYAGENFKGLFSSEIDELPETFKKSVIDRKVYIKNENRVKIHTQNKDLFLSKKFKIRSEVQDSGFNEAVYKIRFDNKTFWLKDQAFVIYFKDDNVTVSIGNLTNVTKEMEAEEARLEAEEKLIKSQKLLQSLFNQSYDPVFVTDTKGTIIDCNEISEKTFGYLKKDIIAKNYNKFVAPEERKRFEKNLGGLFKEKNIRTDTVVENKNGKKIPVEVSAVKINNTPPVIQAFIRDISDKILLENEKIKSSKFELVSTMATGIAHDISNILSTILGNVSLALIEAEKSGSKKTGEILQRIEKAGKHLDSLTKNFFRISDWSSIIKQHVDAKRFFEPFIEKYKDLMTIKLYKDNDVNTLNINSKMMESAVDAVLENAFEAMETSDKKLTEIYIKKDDLTESNNDVQGIIEKGKYTLISIKDYGKGISEKNINRVFDPYFSTKALSSAKGTGLGLTKAFSAVKQHNGYITISSKENCGTTLSIYLPE